MNRLVLLFMGAMVARAFGSHQSSGTIAVEGGLIASHGGKGVRSYKGIPFASPPVGGLRWKPPQPVIPWSGVRTADAFRNQCMQPPFPAGSVYFTADVPKDEDCLYLNVWTSAEAGANRPVLVWIHGGNWTRGSGYTGHFDGTELARQGVLVVTMNYRLGVLGFLAHPDLTAESPHHSSGNYGILDQIAALKWVQHNIAAFGGNPSNVTVFGQSAGSWSINVLQASPLAKDLFQRAIGQSGAQFGDLPTLSGTQGSLPSAETKGIAVAAALKAGSVRALREIPAAELIDVSGFQAAVNVDGWLLPDSPSNIFARHQQNDVPIIVGSTANETTTQPEARSIPTTLEEYRAQLADRYGASVPGFNAVYPVFTEAQIRDAVLGSSRDSRFTLPMRTWARMNGRSRAYLYQFVRVEPRPEPSKLGAYHGSEVIYVFRNTGMRPWMQATDRRVAETMSSYWINFAKTGNPNGPGLPTWTAYDQSTEPYMEFGDTPRQRTHLLKAQLDFLEVFALRSK